MPELGPYGSVRGARGNSRPYRESSWPTTKMTRLTRIGHPAGFAFYELLLARSMIDQLGPPLSELLAIFLGR